MPYHFRRFSPAHLPALTLCGCLLIFAIILSSLTHPTSLGDGIRHLTLARLLLEGKPFGGWGDILYSGYFSTHSVDPWFLTHMLLIPLGFLDTTVAQDILILLLASSVGITTLAFLRSLRLPYGAQSVLIALLLLGHVQFSLRLLLGRPLFFMVSLTVLALLLILQRRTLPLVFLMIVAPLLSHLFVFPLLICILGSLWLLTLSAWRKALFVLSGSLLGTSIGFSLHPQTGNFLHYILTVFLRIPFFVQLHTGTEMHSGLGRMAAVVTLLGISILLGISLRLIYQLSWREMHARGLSLTTGIVVAMSFGMLIWIRMLDFLWPLLIILLAQVLSLRPSVAAETTKRILPQWTLRRTLALGVLFLILTVNTAKISRTIATANTEHALTLFAEPMGRIPRGSRVLNVDWDLFPALFSTRPDLLYARGMDPSYDYVLDTDVLSLFSAVRSPSEETDWDTWLQELIRRVPSDYLVLWRENRPDVITALENTQRLKRVGLSRRIVVYKILASPEHRKRNAV